MKKEVLYKYRGLSNLKRFLEIILNKKLYGALYTELNDPMEGSFRYNYKIPHEIYNPQNEMFRLLGTKRSFSQNETFFFSHPYPALFRLISHF